MSIGIPTYMPYLYVCLEKKLCTSSISIFPQVFFKFGFKSPMTLLVDGSGAVELVKNWPALSTGCPKPSYLRRACEWV